MNRYGYNFDADSVYGGANPDQPEIPRLAKSALEVQHLKWTFFELIKRSIWSVHFPPTWDPSWSTIWEKIRKKLLWSIDQRLQGMRMSGHTYFPVLVLWMLKMMWHSMAYLE